MKIRHVFLMLLLLALLTSCRVPFAPPPATPTPTATATATSLPTRKATITLMPYASRTRLPTETPTSSRTPRAAPTITPTGTSIYPLSLGTQVPDPGFVAISSDNAAKLTPIFELVQQNIWTTATSRDGKQLFVATNRGVYAYDRTGLQLAHWPSLMLPSQPCESCLSINTDGSRFAMMTHKDSQWRVQVYNVFDDKISLLLEKKLEATFQGIPNEVNMALSPDGMLLAYGIAGSDTLLIDIGSSQVLLTNPGGATSAVFSPDGAYFVIRRARQMLFWKTPIWKNPINLLLPSDEAVYTFSADSKRLAIASTDSVTAYQLDTLQLNRAIAIATPKDLKRNWQISFFNENILAGYNTRWNPAHTKATVEVAQWNLDTGETLQLGTHETDSPDGLAASWGAPIPSVPLLDAKGVEFSDQYDIFRFVELDKLLINSAHSACWLRFSTADTKCYNDPKYRVMTSQTEAYREIRSVNVTILQNWGRTTVAQLAQPYPILGLDWLGDIRLINVKDATTDLYRGKNNSLINSYAGTLVNYVENNNKMVLNLQQKPSGTILALLDKRNQETIYLKTVDFVLKPMALNSEDQLFFIQQNVGQSGVVLKTITGKGEISDIAVLPLPIAPTVMSISANGTFAFGMKDGNVTIVSPNGLQLANFQAAYTPINGIALTADGRTLAVVSADGLRVFAVLP